MLLTSCQQIRLPLHCYLVLACQSLGAWLTSPRELRNCSVHCVTEKWDEVYNKRMIEKECLNEAKGQTLIALKKQKWLYDGIFHKQPLKRRVELNYVLFLTSIYLHEGLPLLLDYLPWCTTCFQNTGKNVLDFT